MIATFYPPYHFGGDATYVRSLARALVCQGHEVEIIHCVDAYALKEDYAILPETAEDGITVHRLRSPWRFLSPLITQQTGHPGLKAHRIRAILRRGFDVIHFHNISLVGGPAILRMGQAPVKLYTLHEHWLLCPTHIFWKNRQQSCDRPQCIRCCLRSGIPPQWWRYTDLIHQSVTHIDALLSPSEYTANRHHEAGLTAPIHVLPLFSNLNPGTPLHYCPGDRPKFLFVGRMTASKGIEPLLAALAKLPGYDLDVVGDGELRERLQQRYARYANIRFWGKLPQHQLVSLYQNATSLVFPSLAPETFGLTIVEAFACGTPVIAHDAGGSRELIERTGAGFVYRSEAELHEALHALAEKPLLRLKLGQLAYEGFQRYYTEEIHVSAYLERIEAIQTVKGITRRN